MSLVLIGSILIIIYTYLGYPVLLSFLGGGGKAYRVKKEHIFPKVTIIIPAYNEERSIEQKLENVLALEYPKDKLEVIVASDCSNDRTDEIVKKFESSGVILSRLARRGGKIAGYKQAIVKATGKIIVFTDATSHIEQGSLTALVSSFFDQDIGCVGGKLEYHDPAADHVGKGESTYWNYETRIKLCESSLHSLTSVSGTFYAVRKELFPMDIPDDLADDLIVPMNVVKNGKRVVFEPSAICREETVFRDSQEVRKRYRITVQNIRGLRYMSLLNVFKYGIYAFMLFSHKVLRLLSPIILIIIFAFSIFLLRTPWVAAFLICQIVFYLLGMASHFYYIKNLKIINAVHYFCLSNYAILIGYIKFLKGEKMATWDTERRSITI